MVIDVLEILRKKEDSVTFDQSVDLSEVEVSPGVRPFQEPVRVFGRVDNIHGAAVLRIQAEGTAKMPCDRCLKDVVVPFSREADLRIEMGDLPEEESEFVLTEDGKLDLAELAVAEIMMDMPTKVICAEECAGICPTCGKDLNLGGCECAERDIDPRLVPLMKFFEEE